MNLQHIQSELHLFYQFKNMMDLCRFARDYKVTVNKVTQCDKYPAPRTKDLLATLNGGERFSKLDLSRAYQRLVLGKGSRTYLTVNTNKGLFQPNRLQYGIHSTVEIFQKEIEKCISHVPFTVLRMEDILVSGKMIMNIFKIWSVLEI